MLDERPRAAVRIRARTTGERTCSTVVLNELSRAVAVCVAMDRRLLCCRAMPDMAPKMPSASATQRSASGMSSVEGYLRMVDWITCGQFFGGPHGDDHAHASCTHEGA